MATDDQAQVTATELLRAKGARELQLTDRGLTALPPEVVQLTNLQTLRLRDNQLTGLPAEIGQFTNLQLLDLRNNQLTSLPAEIGQLTNLHTLHLGGNQFTSLPPEITGLTKLQLLDFGRNQFTSLPPEIGQLTNLRVLYLHENRLTGLPPEITQLTNLDTLDLSGNELTSQPPEIAQLTNLQELYLSGNQLTSLPPEITRLTKLHTLRLRENRLTDLPPEITQLLNLELVDLGGNQLTSLPPEIGQLTNLRVLYLSGNQLTGLPPEITRLTSLQTLRLRGNQFTSPPPEITQLTSLRVLHLGDNQLTSLPVEIIQLPDLQELHLDRNQLTTLPPELADPLVHGLVLELVGNPLREPLPELVERGADALASYLRSLKDAIPHYEAKVLLVGEGNVGKTSLVGALLDDPFVPGRPTTHGVEIRPLTLPHPNQDVVMKVRTWDFGGQEVYRITHQFFFSPRALYLVVWNAREGQEQNEVEGWLRRIRVRVGHDTPTLVVATHCDERNPELDYPGLQRTFQGMLVGRHEVDNFSRNGIPELRNAIAEHAARLPQMGQPFSPRWIAARDEILARAKTEPQISYEEFVAVCQRHQVPGDEITALAGLLHDLGLIIYYGDDEGLRDIVVLNPEWLTKAISYVLEDKPTREDRGVLDHSRLKEIWQERQNGAGYPARYYPYFLRLMEKFDVSYRLADDEHKSLVAQLVPPERPELPWDDRTPPAEGVRTLALMCELSEPAPGLVAWLTVRQHRASTGRHWRSGVFLRYPIDSYDSEALLEQRDNRHLAIEVRAPSPDFFFNVVRDSVEDLLIHRWPGLNYELLIPCPTRNSDATACPGKFKLGKLHEFRERGKLSIDCQECGERHDIGQLLTGFAMPPAPLQPQLERLQEQVASGFDRLERYAADTAGSMRRVLRAVATEVTDCPRLFTLTREQPAGMGRLKLYEDRYQLMLWCEHPGQWHPWPAATYHLQQSKDWLVRVSPYANLVLKTLQLVVPVATAVAGVTLTEDQLKHAKPQIELMKTLVGKLPSELAVENPELEAGEPHSQLTAAEGEALRGVRALLFQQDPMRSFGDLRRVPEPSSGEFLWVCTTHRPEYDPGLPSIPGSEPRD